MGESTETPDGDLVAVTYPEQLARLAETVDVVMYELVGMQARIRKACGRAVNDTPRPVPVKPVQPKQPPPPPPKDEPDVERLTELEQAAFDRLASLANQVEVIEERLRLRPDLVERVGELEQAVMTRTGSLDDRVRVLEVAVRHIGDSGD